MGCPIRRWAIYFVAMAFLPLRSASKPFRGNTYVPFAIYKLPKINIIDSTDFTDSGIRMPILCQRHTGAFRSFHHLPQARTTPLPPSRSISANSQGHIKHLNFRAPGTPANTRWCPRGHSNPPPMPTGGRYGLNSSGDGFQGSTRYPRA